MSLPEGPISARPLLHAEGLRVRFAARGRRGRSIAAVDGVSLAVASGEALGIVGESGSGKSTLGRAILRLVPVESGRVTFDGVDVLGARGRVLRSLRRDMQMVFQDSAGSLDPRQRVADIVLEPLIVHGLVRSHRERRKEAASLLDRCGVASSALERFPHELSGGQRQRVGIARALALKPRLLVCDEPTSALDVSVQAQIVNLLADLRRDLGLSYIFISHDLAIVRHLCSRIIVLRSGRIVEEGASDRVVREPEEDYTRALISAAPDVDSVRDARAQAARETPSIAS
jgi:ABC-type glutathione transport system ATPase component